MSDYHCNKREKKKSERKKMKVAIVVLADTETHES